MILFIYFRLLIASVSTWFDFLPESVYVYACCVSYARLHTEAAKEEEVEEDDEIDGYPSNEDGNR